MDDYIIYSVIAVSSFIFLLYFLFDFNYFVNMFVTIFVSRILCKKTHILGETEIIGVCLTTDIDILWTHMNNARFVRELDFAKLDFFQKTRLHQAVKTYSGSTVIGATTIRYRRLIKLFSWYTVSTRIVYWDDQNIYMEHRFISMSDNFINAICMCKVSFVNCSVERIFDDLNCSKEKPCLAPELLKWIESNELSSKSLRCNVADSVVQLNT